MAVQESGAEDSQRAEALSSTLAALGGWFLFVRLDQTKQGNLSPISLFPFSSLRQSYIKLAVRRGLMAGTSVLSFPRLRVLLYFFWYGLKRDWSGCSGVFSFPLLHTAKTDNEKGHCAGVLFE